MTCQDVFQVSPSAGLTEVRPVLITANQFCLVVKLCSELGLLSILVQQINLVLIQDK